MQFIAFLEGRGKGSAISGFVIVEILKGGDPINQRTSSISRRKVSFVSIQRDPVKNAFGTRNVSDEIFQFIKFTKIYVCVILRFINLRHKVSKV